MTLFITWLALMALILVVFGGMRFIDAITPGGESAQESRDREQRMAARDARISAWAEKMGRRIRARWLP